MIKLQFWELAIVGLQFSAAVAPLLTTFSENAIADILGAFKGTTTSINNLISGLEYSTSAIQVSAPSTTVTPEITSIAGLLPEIASSTTPISTPPSLPSTTGTTATSGSSITGEKDGVFKILLSVVKALAQAFGLSDSVVNTVKNAMDELEVKQRLLSLLLQSVPVFS